MFNWIRNALHWFLNLFREYEWLPYHPINTAGFDFTDRILNDDAKPTGKTAKIHGQSCRIYKTTTCACVYWEKGDPVEPVYYAVGENGIFYDGKTVGKFWSYVISKPPERYPDLEAEIERELRNNNPG